MARFEDMEWHRAAREQEAAALRYDVITRHGEALGEAYLGYAHGKPSTFEEQAQRRATFAEAIVNVLENGTYEERVQGMSALLGSFEAKITPVARRAADADMRTAPIG